MNIINKIKLFLANEDGAETVEWVVVCAGIAAMAIAIYSSSTATGTLGGAISAGITKIAGLIPH